MSWNKVIYTGIASLLIGGLAMLYYFNPAQTAVFLPCPFHYVTGYHCPGCGSLRAIHSLLHGRIDEAMALNPLMVVSIPVVGVMLLNPPWVYKRWVPWTAFWILVLYGIIRNIPIWPLNVLAPK